MSIIDLTSDEQAIVQNELAAIFISLELSESSSVPTNRGEVQPPGCRSRSMLGRGGCFRLVKMRQMMHLRQVLTLLPPKRTMLRIRENCTCTQYGRQCLILV